MGTGTSNCCTTRFAGEAPVHRPAAACPRGHALRPYSTRGTACCDGCGRQLALHERVLDCRSCNWMLCDACSIPGEADATDALQAPAGMPSASRFRTEFLETYETLEPCPDTASEVRYAEEVQAERQGWATPAEQGPNGSSEAARLRQVLAEVSVQVEAARALRAKQREREDAPPVLAAALGAAQGALEKTGRRWKVLGDIANVSRSATDRVLHKTVGGSCADLGERLSTVADYVDKEVLSHHVRAYRRRGSSGADDSETLSIWSSETSADPPTTTALSDKLAREQLLRTREP